MRDDRVGLLDGLTLIASQAAAAILAVRGQGSTGAKSPIARRSRPPTRRPRRSSWKVWRSCLPGIPVVSEENSRHRHSASRRAAFLLVDPLDGTREFLAGRDEYTVNIAIIA